VLHPGLYAKILARADELLQGHAADLAGSDDATLLEVPLRDRPPEQADR
jgi:hypothetical protein